MSTNAVAAISPIPLAICVRGATREASITRSPFVIGRRDDCDLRLDDPTVSRQHAEFVVEGEQVFVVDRNSTLGTYVNGARIERRYLQPNDRIALGRNGIEVVFRPSPQAPRSAGPQSLIARLSPLATNISKSPLTELDGVNVFLKAARQFNASSVVDDVLATLLDTSLELTKASRGFVYRVADSGTLRLVTGRDKNGEVLTADHDISRSILQQAADSGSRFVFTDTSAHTDLKNRASIVAHDLRSVLCIPLYRAQWNAGDDAARSTKLDGVLYLDSHFATGALSKVNEELLTAVASSASTLLDNARLVEAEQQARLQQREMEIASRIQQQLMQVRLPETGFATVDARSIACKEIGGDFYDVVSLPDAIAVVIVDVSGKGVTSALLASTMQGIICSQLESGRELPDIAAWVNRFFDHKKVDGKYATMVLAKLRADGNFEYLNCGHVPAVIKRAANGSVERLGDGNLPVGLLPLAQYRSKHLALNAGDQVVFVTDGVTEASDESEEMFGEPRLADTFAAADSLDHLFDAVRNFVRAKPLDDDCTAVLLRYNPTSNS